MEIIRCVGVTRKFGDFYANKDIHFSVAENEIKAVVGENGAGKTTLMNVLYGLLEPTGGYVEVRGERVDFSSPVDAIRASIGMVHQHFKLVPTLTVRENILLGAEVKGTLKLAGRSVTLPLLSRRKGRAKVHELIERFGFDLDPDAPLRDLSVGAKQKVEILKMLYRSVDILIFDEPTAVLTPQEIEDFFVSLRQLKAQGKTIIIITHKLKEVMMISDSVTVIKKGEVVKNVETAETSERELAQLMVGRDVLLSVESDHMADPESPVVYEAENLSTRTDDGRKVVDGVSFAVREGEILGIAGVEGNGQSELIRVLSGLMRSTGGSIRMRGEDITNSWPRGLRDRRIGIIPEERYVHGLCREMTLSRNSVAGYHYNSEFCSHGLMKKQAIEQWRDKLIKDFDIRISDADARLSSLSGGTPRKSSSEGNSNPIRSSLSPHSRPGGSTSVPSSSSIKRSWLCGKSRRPSCWSARS